MTMDRLPAHTAVQDRANRDTASPERETATPPDEGVARLSGLVRLAAVALGYYAAAWLGPLTGDAPVIALWLPSGLALAAVLLWGLGVVPGVTLGALVAALQFGASPAAALAEAAGATLSALAAGWLLARAADFSRRLNRPRHILTLVAIGAFLAPLAGATLGMAGRLLHEPLAFDQLLSQWVMWWARDALGVLLFTPLVLAWTADRAPEARSTRNLESVGLALLQVLVYVYVFLTQNGPTAYICLPVALLSALYLGLRWVAVTNLLTFAIAAVGTAQGTGPFSVESLTGNLLHLQTYGLIAAVTMLIVASLAAERRRVGAQLKEAAERFRRLSALSSDWYWEQDQQLRFTFVSEGFEEKAHLARGPRLGRTGHELGDQFESEEARRVHEAILAARKPFRDLHLWRHDDHGQVRWVAISGEPVFDDKGRFRGYRGVGRDITAAKQGERALRVSEQRLRSLVHLSYDWYWEQDEELRFTVIAGRAADEGRMLPESLLGKTRWELAASEVSAEDRRRHDQAVAERRAFHDVVMTHHDAGGEPRMVSISGEPVVDEDGVFRGYRGVARDITLERRAAREIEESRKYLDALIDAIPSPVLVKDEQHRYIAANAAFCRFFRRGIAEILGKTDYEFFGRDDAAFFQATDTQALAGVPVEYERDYVRDAHLTRMMVRKSALTRPDGSRVVVLLLIDVTERKAAEEQLRASEQRFRSLAGLSADWYWEQDAQLRYTYVSAEAESKSVTHPSELIGRTRFDLDIDWGSDTAREAHREALAAHRPFRDLLLFDRPSGRYVLVSGEPVLDADGRFAGYRGVGRDVTEQQRVEQALRESEIRFRDFADAAGEYVWEADLEGRFTYVSSRVQSVWTYSDQELIGRSAMEFMPPGEAERVREWLAHSMRPDGSFRDLEHRIVTRSGDTRWVLVNAVGILDHQGRRTGQRGTGRDVTDRKTAEARISYLATRDPLTELPNRVLFNDRLEQGIVAARRTGQSLALMFIDLDRFKYINDSLGHQVGDLLLKEVALRMLGCIRKGDTLSRLGGDEFVVTLEGLQQAEDAAQVAAKIIKALARPFEIAGQTLNTSCSIGISIFPLDAEDDRTLMKNADTAMYHAKEKGRNNYQFFSSEMNVRAVERHTLETALRLAIDRQEFVLYYQPQVDIRSGKVVGMEALLRWVHPERGLLSPATFIAVAEESGLIEPIGQWALRTACQRARAWLDAGYPPLKIAVNISPRQLLRPREFSRSLMRTLSATGLDPQYLELEMTESLLLHNAEDNIAVLRKLGKDGVRIAVDDFGTGYSSLAYLRQLPIDTLKIDRTFVRDIESDPEDAAIIHAVVAMGHSLDLQVTAEGVESMGQLQALQHLGCDEYQGYLFSKPLPAVEIAAKFLAPRSLDLSVPNL
jgi:diguanylate cyclase (GGDEF)-like protein/PAS domain S-box-containing protein